MADRHRRLAVLGAAGSGGLAAFGHVPFSLWPLGLAGLALAGVLVARAPRARSAAWRGWAAGTGFFLVTLHWIVEPFLVDIERHGWMAPFALGLMASGLALFWAAAAALGWAAATTPRRRGLALVGALGLAEMLRSVLFTGFPWVLPAYLWTETPVIQWTALIGPHGLGLLTLLLCALVFIAPRRALAGGLLAAALAGLWVTGVMRAAHPDAEEDTAAAVLRLVQPNAAQHLKWRPEMVEFFLDRQIALSAAPPAGGGPPPDLVIWPETAVEFLLERPHGALERMAAALAPGASLAFGVRRLERGRAFNSLAVIDAAATVTHVYDKHHLVPFGEYLPFGELAASLGLFGLAAGPMLGFSPGPGPQVLDLGTAGRAVPLICYEAIFPWAVARAPRRPDWMLQVTNDAWFGTFAGPYQHLAQARVRAIEQGLPLMRVANTGVTAAIDARGHLLAEIPLGQSGAVDIPLPPALPATPYARTGDLPAWIAAMVLLAAVGLGARRKPIDLDRA